GCGVRVSGAVRLGRVPHGVLHRPGRQLAYPSPPLRRVLRPHASVMQVEQVDFVSVPTRDLPRALAFYREVLGLPESEYSEGELEAPNVTIGFWAPEADGE